MNKPNRPTLCPTRRFLLASTPAKGHITPLLAISSHLVGRGHEVVFFTTDHYRQQVEETGARHVGFDPTYDAHDLMAANPLREDRDRRRVRGLKDDLRHIFIDPALGQYNGLIEILSGFSADVLVCDSTFLGVAPFGLDRLDKNPPAVANRPTTSQGQHRPTANKHLPIAMIGVLPLPLSSRDTAPFGLGMQPASGPLGHFRNKLLNWITHHVVLGDIQRYIQTQLRENGFAPLDRFFIDASADLVDSYLQTTIDTFEYPRTDLHSAITFVGPILAPPTPSFSPPSWWADLDSDVPVIHVTQGTLDNYNLNRLIIPTMRALADDKVLVVATTGGPDPEPLRRLAPSNARVERFIPHDKLLPKVDIMITNGGYGGVQQALANGVPLIVAGDSEDKPEVAARVHWSKTGINLKNAKPSPDKIRQSVFKIQDDQSYRLNVSRLQREILATDPLGDIEAILMQLAKNGPKVEG